MTGAPARALLRPRDESTAGDESVEIVETGGKSTIPDGTGPAKGFYPRLLRGTIESRMNQGPGLTHGVSSLLGDIADAVVINDDDLCFLKDYHHQKP